MKRKEEQLLSNNGQDEKSSWQWCWISGIIFLAYPTISDCISMNCTLEQSVAKKTKDLSKEKAQLLSEASGHITLVIIKNRLFPCQKKRAVQQAVDATDIASWGMIYLRSRHTYISWCWCRSASDSNRHTWELSAGSILVHSLISHIRDFYSWAYKYRSTWKMATSRPCIWRCVCIQVLQD